jgi:hypothetical protein|tara:strand:+ start:2438 stop:2665 length:228 start_codon:yes stop_codon:yes gene_type:complete
MAILDLLEKKKSEAIDPCMNELTSGGMKIIEAAELIMSRVPLNLLQNINKELMNEIMGIDEQKDKINDAYTKKGV